LYQSKQHTGTVCPASMCLPNMQLSPQLLGTIATKDDIFNCYGCWSSPVVSIDLYWSLVGLPQYINML